MNYAALSSKAAALITSLGQSLTFTRTTEGVYNPATGRNATTTATYTKQCAVTNYEANEIGDAIQKGDLKLVAEAYAYAIGDSVAIDGQNYRIVDVNQYNPAGVLVACTLQVRK